MAGAFFPGPRADDNDRVGRLGRTVIGLVGASFVLGPNGGVADGEAPRAGRLARAASTHRMEFDGRLRTYRLYVPKHVRHPKGLVVVLHGGFGSGAGAARMGNWDAAARRHRFVALFPDGIARSWNAGRCCGPPMRRGIDDVGFLVAVTKGVARHYDISPGRVYATGISNGGMMAYRLACDGSEIYAAIAPVAATLMTDCGATRPVSLLHIHGRADRNVPFDGGFPTKSAQRVPPSYPSVRDSIERFLGAQSCGEAAARVTRGGGLVREQWDGCRDNTSIELITIDGGGHSWPGGHRMSPILDPPSSALDATETIWQFFDAHPRR